MKLQKEYWDKKIENWTDVSYGKQLRKVSLIEQIATRFREITKRMDVTLDAIGPKIKNKVIIDMGCGLGDFCFEALKFSPKKVIGIDISEVAVEKAKSIAKKKKLQNIVKFLKADIGESKSLPDFDIAVGLGFIDYLNKDELQQLFRLLEKKQYFFSYFEKRFSLLNILHSFYIKIQKCPGAFKYTKSEIKKILPKKGKHHFYKKDGLIFITNIPNLRN